MQNKREYRIAMKILGTTNIFKTFLLYVKWLLNPNLAIKIAKDIYDSIPDNEYDQPKIIAIGYLNEFFSKYIAFGKSSEQIIKINQKIDQKEKVDNVQNINDKIINTLIELRDIRQKVKKFDKKSNDQMVPTKSGFGVSEGIASGKVLNFNNTKQEVPNNCIGIFPTSGVKYTTQFLKCVGIVFKNGSVTSHGAILAREFGIPAIVSPDININDNEQVEINGITGTVKRVVDRGN